VTHRRSAQSYRSLAEIVGDEGHLGRWGAALAGVGLLLAFCLAIVLLQRAPENHLRTYRGLPPSIPEAAHPSPTGERFVNLPDDHTASLYRSPIDGDLISEWPGGAQMMALGQRFFDGHTDWELVRDPSGNEAWIAALFLEEQLSEADPPADEEYLGPVWWEGEIVFCTNPAGGPSGLDGDAFVALVERAAARWQEVADGLLPLVSRGRCGSSPDARDDGLNTIGWADDLGLAIAAQAWPNAEHGVVSEIDIRVSRGYFLRLQARDPAKTLQTCVFSTVVHEIGHVLGLDHPRSRAVPSSMQGVGASRCDKGQPTTADKANLLRRYGPAGATAP
jgi:hypothetical protein